MSITTLKLSAFRCFEQADFQLSPGINVLSGPNGSGKTSVLEAVNFLSTGKSFRTAKPKNMIKKGSDAFSVFAQLSDNGQQQTLGCQLDKSSKKTLKHNQHNIKKQTVLAATLPTLSIDPHSYLFCDNTPQYRRSFLDWMVFHVKHDYILLWRQVVKLQKHINHLLKHKKLDELKVWLAQYVKLAEQLNEERYSVFSMLQKVFNQLMYQLMPNLSDTQLNYQPGWSSELSLSDTLLKDMEGNLQYGQLRNGIHRMDIQVKSSGHFIKDIYSRGQKKMTALICYLSCLKVMDNSSDHHSLLCLDDFDAELDGSNAHFFFDYIKTLPNQILISTVDNQRYENKEVKMFHVKQL